MIKIINFFIPFLLEMLFGKNNDKQKEAETKKATFFKKGFVYLIMMLSFSFNYFSINKVYNLSINYITVKTEKAVIQAKLDVAEGNKARADQLEKSLEFCMSNTYQPKKLDRKQLSGKIN